MTVVEFFDRPPIQNMLSCLTLNPRKVIFVGAYPKTQEDLKKYRVFLQRKGLNIETVYEKIDITDLQNIEAVLTRIVLKEENCVFDLTGGDDLLLVAAGMVYAKFRGQNNIKLQRFDINSGKLLDCDDDGLVTKQLKTGISIEDLIILNGGRIISKGYGKEYLSTDFTAAVDELWKIAKKDPVKWNKMTSALSLFEKYKDSAQNGLTVKLNLPQIQKAVKDFDQRKELLLDILNILSAMRMIYGLRIKSHSVEYVYKNSSVKQCLAKSGNMLELKVFKEANRVLYNGEPYFLDSYTGVCIEWEQTGHFSSKNEIDVCLMRNLVPLFISCKNGAVNEDELYKLNSVAEEFGGENVKMVLIITDNTATDLSPSSMNFFRQRAKNMGIKLIENARNLTKEQWEETFLHLV